VPRTRRDDKRSRAGEKEGGEGCRLQRRGRNEERCGGGRKIPSTRVVQYEVTMREKREVMHRSGGGEEGREGGGRNRLQ